MNLRKNLIETFGEPLISTYDKKNAKKRIVNIGFIVTNNELKDDYICSKCKEMIIGGSCGCDNIKICPTCKEMPSTLNSNCSCELIESCCADTSSSTTNATNPGDFAADILSMSELDQTDLDELDLEETCVDQPPTPKAPDIDIEGEIGKLTGWW